MPNTRRRRFSVQGSLSSTSDKVSGSSQTFERSPDNDNDIRQMAQNLIATKANRMRSKIPSIGSKLSSLEILTECESELTLNTKNNLLISKMDKNVTASSSNIDLINMINSTENSPPPELLKIVQQQQQANEKIRAERHEPRSSTREIKPLNRDRYPKQHRIKVRSPKRRQITSPEPNKVVSVIVNKTSSATNTDNWKQEKLLVIPAELIQPEVNHKSVIGTNTDLPIEFDTMSADEPPVIDNLSTDDVVESSNHSLEDMCRICHGGESLVSELGQMISACACRGTVGRVHVKCLEHWLTESGKSRCELCGTRYATRRVHRYGVFRAIIMWILSQNAKQLMVDSLGIMLMSPLAVLAAWLSGRTLGGLMTKDNEVTPWPLASTFVLACMTLVCYYCWIVSAVTRHALGWWIWYRSQYEVRLQSQEGD